MSSILLDIPLVPYSQEWKDKLLYFLEPLNLSAKVVMVKWLNHGWSMVKISGAVDLLSSKTDKPIDPRPHRTYEHHPSE